MRAQPSYGFVWRLGRDWGILTPIALYGCPFPMKRLFFILTLVALLPAASAQDRIYRCGNEYTNDERQARNGGCRRVEGGNITILETTPRSGGSGGGSKSSASSPPNAPRVTPAQQNVRDSDARAILNAELMRAETRLDAIRKEYSEQPPERTESQTEDLKAALARAEADVEGIKREIARLAP